MSSFKSIKEAKRFLKFLLDLEKRGMVTIHQDKFLKYARDEGLMK